MSSPSIDLNCDLGEGCGDDEAIMPFVTSANIACGGHAGDLRTMRATVELARIHDVAIGAHPGYVDPGHFGRRELSLEPEEIVALVAGQVRALQAIAPVVHVKPHGALYNLAARDAAVASAVARGVRQCGWYLVLVGLAGSAVLHAGQEAGLRVAGEAFADRRYRADGSLADRLRPDALIVDESEALAQALDLVQHGCVRTLDGTMLALKADTLCLHGDGPNAVRLARRLREGLVAAGVTVRRFAP